MKANKIFNRCQAAYDAMSPPDGRKFCVECGGEVADINSDLCADCMALVEEIREGARVGNLKFVPTMVPACSKWEVVLAGKKIEVEMKSQDQYVAILHLFSGCFLGYANTREQAISNCLEKALKDFRGGAELVKKMIEEVGE